MRHLLFSFTLFLATLFSGCGNDESSPAVKAPPPLEVEILVAQKRPVAIWETFTGTAKASSEQVVKARVSGRLIARYFKDGQIVQKGQKLFLIEPDHYEAALKAAEAQKKRDDAKLRLAQANVARYRPLVEEGLAPRATLEEFEAQVAQFKAAILADEAKIAEARLNLDYTLVRAPITGRAGARKVDVGNLVGVGEATPLVSVLGIDPIYVTFSPSEKEAQKIRRYGGAHRKRAIIRIPASDEMLKRIELNATVDFADNRVDLQTSTVTMRATAPNPKGALLPGTFVYLDLFVTDRYPFFTVPVEAVFEDQRGRFVYVAKDGKAARRAIEVAFTTRTFVAVKKGLEEGDAVIVSQLMKISDGLPVATRKAVK